jgi:hypothetical protein
MIRLFFVASIHALPWIRLSYHRVENPGRGKTNRFPDVKDMGMMMSMGATRKSSTLKHTARER